MNQQIPHDQYATNNSQESNGKRPHNIASVAALCCAIGDYTLFAISALLMYTLEHMPYHPANVLMLIASGLLFFAALPVAGFTVILAVLGLVQCMRHTEQCIASNSSDTASCHHRGMGMAITALVMIAIPVTLLLAMYFIIRMHGAMAS